LLVQYRHVVDQRQVASQPPKILMSQIRLTIRPNSSRHVLF
jgi:hypothetical protein